MTATPEELFWRKVDKSGDCWEWTAAIFPNGYGAFKNGKKNYLAHRWSYEHEKGEIPKGLEIDHLCRNRKCVNPDHLEAVCHTTNVERGNAPRSSSNRYYLKKAKMSRAAWAIRLQKRHQQNKQKPPLLDEGLCNR